MLEEEHPAVAVLLQAQLQGEVDVVDGLVELLANVLLGLVRVVEKGLQRAEGAAHRRRDEHERLIRLELVHGLLPLLGDAEVPWTAVVWVIVREIQCPALPETHLAGHLRDARRRVNLGHVVSPVSGCRPPLTPILRHDELLLLIQVLEDLLDIWPFLYRVQRVETCQHLLMSVAYVLFLCH